MIDLTYDSFEAFGVQEQANRYDARGEVLHGPIPNARNTIAVTEVVFSFPRQLPTMSDLSLLNEAGFRETGTGKNCGREFTGSRTPYRP